MAQPAPTNFASTLTFQHELELPKAAQRRRNRPRGVWMASLMHALVAAIAVGISTLFDFLDKRMEGFGMLAALQARTGTR